MVPAGDLQHSKEILRIALTAGGALDNAPVLRRTSRVAHFLLLDGEDSKLEDSDDSRKISAFRKFIYDVRRR